LSTIAVLDSDTRNPVNNPARQPTPNSMQMPITLSTASPTCSAPPTAIQVRSAASRSRENSIPMMNSKKMTPTSAAASTVSISLTSPSWFGPITTPATRNPMMGTILARTDR